jgi:hypothetical protein
MVSALVWVFMILRVCTNVVIVRAALSATAHSISMWVTSTCTETDPLSRVLLLRILKCLCTAVTT